MWGKPHGRGAAEEPILKGSSSGQAATEPQLHGKSPGSLLPKELGDESTQVHKQAATKGPEPVLAWRAPFPERDQGGVTHTESSQAIAYLLGSSVGSSLGCLLGSRDSSPL